MIWQYDMVWYIWFIVFGFNYTWWFQLSFYFFGSRKHTPKPEQGSFWANAAMAWKKLSMAPAPAPTKRMRRWTCHPRNTTVRVAPNLEIWTANQFLIIIKHFSESKETMQDPHVFQGRHMQQPYVAPLRHIFPWINPLQTAGAEFNSGCCRLQFPGVHFVWLFRPWPVSRRRFRRFFRPQSGVDELMSLRWFPRGFLVYRGSNMFLSFPWTEMYCSTQLPIVCLQGI